MSHSHSYLEKHLLEGVGRYGPGSGLRALDFGCGSGAFTAWLAERGYDALGVDISESGIAVASSAFPGLRFSNDTSPESLAALGPFDIVFCVEVIAHCYDPERILGGLWAALKPGGLLILSTPFHGYFKNLLMALTGQLQNHLDTDWSGAYVHFFTEARIKSLVERSGFEDVSVRRAGRIPVIAKSIVLSCRRPLS